MQAGTGQCSPASGVVQTLFGWISAVKTCSKESRAIRAGGRNLKEILSVGEEVTIQVNP